jgi:3-hydroxyacyl-CoA dehydrogenase/enoyl-CoA hydratase/3-hydroxybutyryl-CoA epimerase
MSAFSAEVRDGIGRLGLNLPDEPVNKITKAVRDELDELLDRFVADRDVRAVVLISDKSDSFIAGADIDEFVALESREEAHELVRQGQALVNRLERLGKPVLAAIHGSCLGAASPPTTPRPGSACPRCSWASSLRRAGANGCHA